jgi:hypothetical protein
LGASLVAPLGSTSEVDLGLLFSFRNPAPWRRPFTAAVRRSMEMFIHDVRPRLDGET